jgi:hypothetical protein
LSTILSAGLSTKMSTKSSPIWTRQIGDRIVYLIVDNPEPRRPAARLLTKVSTILAQLISLRIVCRIGDNRGDEIVYKIGDTWRVRFADAAAAA